MQDPIRFFLQKYAQKSGEKYAQKSGEESSSVWGGKRLTA
jgi:hypothetical protein